MEVQETPLLGWIVSQAGLTDDQAKLVIKKLALLSVNAVDSLQEAATAAAGVRRIETIVERCSEREKTVSSRKRRLCEVSKIDRASLDRILETMAYADENALLALNNVVSEDNSLHNRYLVEKGILPLILPCAHSQSFSLRTLALRVIGSLGASNEPDGFKSAVLATGAVAHIVQSYTSINPSTGKHGPENGRQGYAEVIKLLINNSTASQFQVLQNLIPVLLRIILAERDVEQVKHACKAICHLLDVQNLDSVDFLIYADIISALAFRVKDPNMTQITLKTLTRIVECSNSAQVLHIVAPPGYPDNIIFGCNHHDSLLAVEWLARVCEKGDDQVVQQILNNCDDTFYDLLKIAQAGKSKLSVVREISRSAGLALVYVVQIANAGQLQYFVSFGMYAFLFDLLDDSRKDVRMVREIITALTSMVQNVGTIRNMREEESSYFGSQVSNGWCTMYRMARKPTGSKVESAEERENRQEIGALVEKLYAVARVRGVLPDWLMKLQVADGGQVS